MSLIVYFSATWSALGDAHLYTNNLKTAFNCYKKASTLEQETLYSLTRQAFTLTLLGHYNDAIAIFDKVLDQSPKYILARKGLFKNYHEYSYLFTLYFLLGKGEAHFNLAVQQVGLYKDQLAIHHVQQSLKVIIISIS